MIRILIFLLACFTTAVRSQNIHRPLLKPGLYNGSKMFSEMPTIQSGCYWLKPDSSFVQVGIGGDSLVLHVARGRWYVDNEDSLVVIFEECPIKSLPRNWVSYTASNVVQVDSTMINVAVLRGNDTCLFYMVFIDDSMYVVRKMPGGNPSEKNTNRSINLSGKNGHHRVRISSFNKSIPYFDETSVLLMPGFNIHNIVLHSTPAVDDWQYFRPMKEGEANKYSFKRKFSQMDKDNVYDFSFYKMTFLGENVQELRNILMRAIANQGDYVDYFKWALESL